jgi:hypothetical protein
MQLPKPGECARQVGRADGQRTLRIGQPTRRFGPGAGERKRHEGRQTKKPSIASRATLPRRIRIDPAHVMSALGKGGSACEPDHTSTDDGDAHGEFTPSKEVQFLLIRRILAQ